jgi:multiple sugar transport system substrate-binding protein
MSAPTPLSRRRFIATGAASTAALGFLSSCSTGGSGSSGGKTTVRFSYLWTGDEGKAMESVIAKFNKSQSDIEVKGVSNPDQQAQLAAMTGSKGTFDVSDNFGSVTGSWASKGVIKSLSDYIKKDNFDIDDFVPSALDQCRYEDQLYQLPIAVNNSALLYNKDLFEQGGVKKPPTTTGEWAEAIAKLTKNKDGHLSQLGLGGTSGAGIDYRLMGAVYGGAWYADGKPTPADQGNIDGANFYVDNVIKKYGVKKIDRFVSGFGDYQSPQNPFYQGKLAMVIDGEWQPAFIKEFAPKLNWGVVPVPYPDGKKELANTNLVNAGSIFIPSNSQHPDEAWEFVKYLLSKDAMAEFTLALSNLPARTSLLTDDAYADIPNFDVFLRLLGDKNAASIASEPSYAQYTSDLGTADDQITRLVKTPAAAYGQVAKSAMSYG